MQILHIPANYDVWLTGLKAHLDRHRGSKAELARMLSRIHDISEQSAVVKLARILNGHRKPEMEVFFDIAGWLQRQQDALHDPVVLMPLAPPDAEKPPRPLPLPKPARQARTGK